MEGQEQKLYSESELPKAIPAASCSKIFRFTDMDGVLEKVFVDHDANPRRAYPTGEYYELVEEGEDLNGREVVTIMSPSDFAMRRYKRISDLADDCIVSPEPILGPSGS